MKRRGIIIDGSFGHGVEPRSIEVYLDFIQFPNAHISSQYLAVIAERVPKFRSCLGKFSLWNIH